MTSPVHNGDVILSEAKDLPTIDAQALLNAARSSPQDAGVLKHIVLRLPNEQRATPLQAVLTRTGGVIGDNWGAKAGRSTDRQISVINSRFLEAIAEDAERMALSGDNLVVDLDLHQDNLPVGARLRIGEAVLEVTDHPHTGCVKFERRYGKAALDLTNTPEGLAARLRGLLARVIQEGDIRPGDPIHKEAPHA
jgi:MOSC domain-containing protein YiiM